MHRRTPALTRNQTLRIWLALSSEERKRTKIRSGWFPSSEKWKEPSFVRPFRFSVLGGASEFQRMKKNQDLFASFEEWKRTKIHKYIRILVRVGFRSLEKVEPRFVRSGGFLNSEEQNIKIRFGLTSEDRKKRNQDSFGWASKFRRTEKDQDS
ncbi:unnamed protein product [Rhizophagus irregularis]|nr:unnamed protein product [Rhizophagus irregularis]